MSFEQYRWTILVGLVGIAAAIAVYLYMKQEQKVAAASEETLMMRAEHFAERRAIALADERLAEYLKQPGIRAQIGDMGTENDLYAAHDFETNATQMAPGVTATQWSASLPVDDSDDQSYEIEDM